MSAQDIIRVLDLRPHPEGGHFRETFRDRAELLSGRSASTAIYFLLKAGETSCWHRIDTTELWHWYAGAALELSVSDGFGSNVTIRLGNDIASGERPQAVVSPHHWQRARSRGAWTLAGCTVAPGFEFSTLELAAAAFGPMK